MLPYKQSHAYTNPKAKTFQKTFDFQICTVLIDLLESKDVFLKFALLNKNFNGLFKKL